MDASSSPIVPAVAIDPRREPQACLPPAMQHAPTLQRIGTSLSGADVYRVDVGGKIAVLKVASADQPLLQWRGRLHVQQLAANAGIAPHILHADELRRAVVTEFVADKSFPGFVAEPRTRQTALTQLGQLLHRVHGLPPPASLEPRPAHDQLTETAAFLDVTVTPAGVSEAIQTILSETPPPPDHAPVLSHNDVHPANLAYDGQRVLLLDWDATGPNDRYFDLGAIALFLRLDEAACRQLLTAYFGAPVSTLPPGFIYHRRFAGVLCGTTSLKIARQRGHATGATGPDVATAPSLGDIFQQLRGGALSLEQPEGQWSFGLALIKAGIMS